MIDNFGHIIHIDFGFILGTSPGRNYGFEKAHFKFTLEYGKLIGFFFILFFKIINYYLLKFYIF